MHHTSLTPLLPVAFLLASATAFAGTYEVNVTRKEQNIYRVDGKGVLIQTQYCYAYAYSEEAILRTNGYGGDLIFVGSRDKCDVKAVFGKANQNPGKYSVRVTRESDNWYEIWGSNVFLQTTICLSLALGQEAFLTVGAGGVGRLVFDDGQSCMVEGIYSKMRLN